MNPEDLGARYDKIASWWQQRHDQSNYGLLQIERALKFCGRPGTALDVGCGCGGRFVRLLTEQGFKLTAIDVSAEMIQLAQQAHPETEFLLQDICDFETTQKYDLILAWDSIFHLPLNQQELVVSKLCRMLAADGVLIYSFGDADKGKHDSKWYADIFHYSTIGMAGNLAVLSNNGVVCKHLELDQWPQNHAYMIGINTSSAT
ncbi:MAG: class I SAM-dependent methyltransferase [Gammaproteobacteria bacterium]|nr:class I SAM-dependent methyltransferase [Gammaproteobacteria bacterium]MCP4981466.1 class I SAM-dependent methyltransferase [Gammaproteobacteria bacterium]